MEDVVREHYEKMLKSKPLPDVLLETYSQAKMLSDRLDGGLYDARMLAIVAVVAGCSPYEGEGAVEPPRDIEFVATAANEADPWTEGAPCEVDWNGTKEGNFVGMSGPNIRVKLKEDGTVRDFRPSRVKMLVRT